MHLGTFSARAGQLVVVVLVVTGVTFLLINLLPGDPSIAILGPDASPQERAVVREALGLDGPLPVRYVEWLGGAVTGDLGESARTGSPVASMLADRFAVSFQLLVVSQALALVVAVPWAIAIAYRSGGGFDRASTVGALGLIAMPNFVLGLILIFVVAIQLDLLPATGWVSLGEDPLGNLRALILPAITLAAGEIAVYTRVLRSDLISTLQQDFVGAAQAQGFTNRRILFRHALRPSSIALLTVVGLNVGRLIGGTVIIENLFALPGLGRLLVLSIDARDYLVVQGVVLVVALGYVAVNFIVDLLYGRVDPRIRDSVGRTT
jgi:peptide/nickel transport system permease protein